MTGRNDALELLEALTGATERLVGAVKCLTEESLHEASLLPEWTRAHLLTHVASNADGARNLLLGIRSGQPVRMYPSVAARGADIETGAGRPPAVIIEDVIESSRRFVIDVGSTTPELWDGQMQTVPGYEEGSSATRPLSMRLREVEFHHVDLATGYRFADTPEPLLGNLLDDTIRRLAGKAFLVERASADEWVVSSPGVDARVHAMPADMLGWLSGRCSIDAPDPLPRVPPLD